MTTRREFLTAGSALLLEIGTRFRCLRADEPDSLPDGSAGRDMITPPAQQAIDQGLAFLSRSQHPDGSFGTGQYEGNIAVTSLAALAFMAGGHQAGRGAFGSVVTRTLEYVLNQEDGGHPGFLHCTRDSTHGPMYGHGFGTLFLAEAQGMVARPPALRDRLRETLKRAVELIINTQNGEGGWRYQPEKKEADISVTICQIMALRAARNAGLYVPKATVDRCIAYVKRCQNRDGGFRYMAVAPQSQTGFARTAAGVVALYSAGVYKGPEIENGLRYLLERKPNQQVHRDIHSLHYFYGHYYAAQAMWLAGAPYWAEWYPAIRDELIKHPNRQPQSGYWADSRVCNDYGTAMACIILQIPNNYLPILQK